MSQLRTLIVDDEPIARKILREELESIDGVEVVGEAENGEKALAEIAAKRPDLVFLDVEMPVLGGFAMINRLHQEPLPMVVMVTAYDQHAIRAFELGAVDYLLKPASQARVRQAVQRAMRVSRSPALAAQRMADLQNATPPGSVEQPGRKRKVVGRVGEEYFLLDQDDILAFQADGDLIWIVTKNKRYQATQNLKSFEQRLPGSLFRRIHRNALINVNQIAKMSMITSQRWLLTLANGQEFIVSKRQAKNVREILHW